MDCSQTKNNISERYIMPSKRPHSDEPLEGETKQQKFETKGMKDDDFKYYSPASIFRDDHSNPREMAGSTNFLLAESFYHSRYTDKNELKSNPFGKNAAHTNRNKPKLDPFCSNAGAVQLYRKDGISLYKIPGYETKEYNCLSYSVFENGHKKTTYGHSERILMKMVLDDLISAHGDGEEIKRPSDYPTVENDERKRNYEILKNLSEKAHIYREYLERKGLIVKMWSERPSCSQDYPGGVCCTFMSRICPAGSQFGYIIEDYNLSEDNKNEAPKVSRACEDLKKAYLEYVFSHKQDVILIGDCFLKGFVSELDESLKKNTSLVSSSAICRSGAPFQNVIGNLLGDTKNMSGSDIVIIVAGAHNQPYFDNRYLPDISMIEELATKTTVVVVEVPTYYSQDLLNYYYINNYFFRAVREKLSNLANVHVLRMDDLINQQYKKNLSEKGKKILAEHLTSVIFDINRNRKVHDLTSLVMNEESVNAFAVA